MCVFFVGGAFAGVPGVDVEEEWNRVGFEKQTRTTEAKLKTGSPRPPDSQGQHQTRRANLGVAFATHEISVVVDRRPVAALEAVVHHRRDVSVRVTQQRCNLLRKRGERRRK